jgi:hypothetical protein
MSDELVSMDFEEYLDLTFKVRRLEWELDGALKRIKYLEALCKEGGLEAALRAEEQLRYEATTADRLEP